MRKASQCAMERAVTHMADDASAQSATGELVGCYSAWKRRWRARARAPRSVA